MTELAREIEDVQDEITVQTVMLQSLGDEAGEEEEEARVHVRQEIENLKVTLAQLLERAAGDDASEQQTDLSSSSNQTNLLGTGSAMSSPCQGSGSSSLPSRKRDLETESPLKSNDRYKHRRTMATPDFSSLSSPLAQNAGDDSQSANMEFLDLSRSDAEIGHLAAGDLKREQERREQQLQQEADDHRMAVRLSQETNPTASPHHPALTPGFARIMSSQQPYSPQRAEATLSSPCSAHPSPLPTTPAHTATPLWHSPHGQSVKPETKPSSSMPGAFPDDSYASGYPSGQSGSPSLLTPGPQSSMQTGATPYAGFTQAGGTPYPGPTQYGAMPHRGAPMYGSNIPNGGPTAMNPGFDALSNIINRTGSYDLDSGVDMSGNPLQPRMQNILADLRNDSVVSEKDLDDLLKNIESDGDVDFLDRGNTPEALKQSLYAHQNYALTWMHKMEDGSNKGGLLADDMGLGKTISTLALMHSRRASRFPKTNLIVAPVALLAQWKDEISTKTKSAPGYKLSVFIYHGTHASLEDLKKYDVVLTTYGTITAEAKKFKKYKDDNEARGWSNDDPVLAKKCPILHPRAKFHRVILDEAQLIKNDATKGAKACYTINSTYRWCLSGTPMMNNIRELYSLVHFLRIRPYNEWEIFRDTFGRLLGKKTGEKEGVAMDRFRALLRSIMLRRKKNSLFDGKPIIELPEKSEEVVYAELSEEERNFYGQLEKDAQVKLSRYLREGTISKNYSDILVLLLRLRQACCHPHLNLDVDEIGPITDAKTLPLLKSLDASTVRRLRETERFECPVCYEPVEAPAFVHPCGHHTCSACLSRVVDGAATENLQQGQEGVPSPKCPECRQVFDPDRCFSYDAFRSVHMPETTQQLDDSDSDDDTDAVSNASDGDINDDDADKAGNLRGFIVDDFAPSSDEETESKSRLKSESAIQDVKTKSHSTPSKPKKKEKGPKKEIRGSMLKNLRKEAQRSRKAHLKYMGYLKRHWLPSSKVSKCLDLLKEIHQTGEKTIVFSQWTLLLDLLETAIKREKDFNIYDRRGKECPYEAMRYDGSMTGDERSKAVNEFKNAKHPEIILVSLRAGNVGLNLTAASRVIIMDPFWNPYTENQAIDRAYRIGQTKNVKVYRILTKETIEDRILDLQQRKKDLVEAALDETASMRISRLSVGELKFLFRTSDRV